MKKLLTVTLFSGLLTLLRMASGFLIAKVVAVYTGPSGMAMLGQVQGLVSALAGLVSAPVGSGIVRYTAENHEQGIEACAPWWKAAVKWSLCLLAIVIPLSCLLSKPLSIWLFGNTEYIWLICIVALSLPFAALNTLITSIINGQQQYRRFIGLGMVSVIVATCLMIVLIFIGDLNGALVAAALSASLPGVIVLLGVIKKPWLNVRYWWGNTEKSKIKDIGTYVLMAATTALTAPIAIILVRNILVSKVGWEQAGYWQAVWKISEVYLGVVTMALSTYYLPRLSSLPTNILMLKEIKSTTKIIFPIVLLLASIIYLLRDIAITLLFTEVFRPARELFFVQLLGDVMKVLSFIYAYPMLARGASRWFVSSEILFSCLFVLLAYICVDHFGVQGANLAYLVNYSLYFLFVFFNVKKL